MDEIQKKQIISIIRQAIDEIVYDEMKDLPRKNQIKQEEIAKTKAQREQDAHDALFGKKEDTYSYQIRLHEDATERPKISFNEISAFEKEFKSHFPGITFDKQIGSGKSGQIVDFPVISGQKDAVTSGKITTGSEIIGFTMSLLNGFKIKSVMQDGQPREFEIKKETKDVFSKVLNLYEEVFKSRFNEIINPSDGEQNQSMDQNIEPTLQPTQPQAPEMPAWPPQPSNV